MLKIIATIMFVLALAPTAAGAAQAVPPSAIVIQNQVALRAAPRDSARPQAVLWQGETLEVRGERLDYLQVYDHRRERAGYVRTSQVRRVSAEPSDAAALLAIVRFLSETAGTEALGVGYVAAYFRAATAETLNGEGGIEALDALGGFADRLARRASSADPVTKAGQATLAAHLEVVSAYGIRFASTEREGRMRVCYDGEAFRRVLAMSSRPEQRARAALALTDPQCIDPDLASSARNRLDEWRADILDRVDASRLPDYLKHRVLIRRSGLLASIAFQHARSGEAPAGMAVRAIAEFSAINRHELTDDDLAAYNDAAIRVSASRWAAMPAAAPLEARGLALVTQPGQPGETCVLLVDAKKGAAAPLASRCTFGLVWAASGTLNREANAFALAVQHTDTWRELWVFSKDGERWNLQVMPPAEAGPELGYVEFAGWVPGGRRMLVARESRIDGKHRHSFEVVRLDALVAEKRALEPGMLTAFRWQDPAWKRQTLSVR